MAEFSYIVLDQKISGLIGLARKAGQMATGLEAVRRAAFKGKLAMILVDESTGESSRKKAGNLAYRFRIPAYVVRSAAGSPGLSELIGYKIVGLYQGGFVKGIRDQLHQEHQWQKQR